MEVGIVFKIESHVNGKVSSNTEALYRELLTLRAEVKHLRDKLPAMSRQSKIVRTAVVDAHAIMLNAFSGQSTGVAAMYQQGMSKRRWAWGVAFLRYAGIVAMNSRQWRTGLEFIVDDLAQAVALLERSGVELMDSKDGYRRLASLLKSS
jgi:hypothetical protein